MPPRGLCRLFLSLKTESEPLPCYFLSRAGPAGTLLCMPRANSAQEELRNSGFQAPQWESNLGSLSFIMKMSLYCLNFMSKT